MLLATLLITLVRKIVRFGNIYFTVLLATEVEFKAKTITVKEDIGLVEITVFLSNPLSSIITFEVYGTDVTATGELRIINNCKSTTK